MKRLAVAFRRNFLVFLLLLAALPVLCINVAFGTSQQTNQEETADSENGEQTQEENGLDALRNSATMPFVRVVLFFTFVSLALLYGYYTFIQSRYYAIAGKGSGQATEIRSVSTPAVAAVGAAAPPLTIEGPSVITVGVMSTEFHAKSSAPAAGTTWSIEPNTNAIVEPRTGGKVKVTAAVPGALLLKATLGGNSQEFQIAAVEPRGATIDLPWVGSGHGSIAIALVLLGVVTIFGITETLDNEAIATILGALAGYIFGGFRTSQNTN